MKGGLWLKRLICVFWAVMMICAGAAAEEDNELSLEDLDIELEEEVSYGDVAWNFPVDLSDMDPDMIRLANKHVFLSKDFVPSPLMTMKSRKNGGVNKASSAEMKLQQTAGEALITMFEAALNDDITLYLKSAYRSYQTQNTMYYNRLKRNNGKDDGWVTPPGGSDHQTGLGCDVVPRSWRDKSMNEQMASTAECQWMAEHCAEYGFVIRYAADKEDVTEINYEPWHLRYVGVPVAKYMTENNLCLEEFHEQLQAAIDEFIAAGGAPSLVQPYIQVSADNS